MTVLQGFYRYPTLARRLRTRFSMPFFLLKRDQNLPDGVLDGGNIITFWSETGYYLSLMQPTVGEMLADFLKEEPENPHAIRMTEEITRLFTLTDIYFDEDNEDNEEHDSGN